MDTEKAIVAVGLSGGADSAMAAYLLREQGCQVVGITMRLWREPQGRASEDASARATGVAQALGIRHEVIDLRDAFRARIVEPFMAAYCAGLTPSPCVRCNALVKFGLMLDCATALGCDRLATGHYARVAATANGRVGLFRGLDPAKDQSYFLAGLRQEQLARAVFPLGGLTKREVAAEGRRLGLVPQRLAESQDLCFIPDGDYAAFLRRQGRAGLPGDGDIVDRQGRLLGRHRGAYGYTVGQRRGLGLGGGPWYVVRTEAGSNRVVVGSRAEASAQDVLVEEVNWVCPAPPPGARFEAEAQVRYNMKPAAVAVALEAAGVVRLHFGSPVHAVTPGQFAVIYRGDEVLAGGWIRDLAARPAAEGGRP